MTVPALDAIAADVVAALRGAGAWFAFVHGSVATGSPRAESDFDVATTRKIYADELPRLQRSHREFAEAVRRGR